MEVMFLFRATWSSLLLQYYCLDSARRKSLCVFLAIDSSIMKTFTALSTKSFYYLVTHETQRIMSFNLSKIGKKHESLKRN